LLDYLGAVPPGSEVQSVSGDVAERGLGDEGIRCVRKGREATAEWDDDRKPYRHERRVTVGQKVGSIECAGRCGIQCGIALRSTWSKDCLDHGVCAATNRLGLLDAGSSENCWDEYTQANDDYFQGIFTACDGS
jgi:hypothetical protein